EARKALASMGPLRERSGEVGIQCLPGEGEDASMGPLRERSGESRHPARGTTRMSGFNGAAARTQRRAEPSRLRAHGAFPLQWGRCANAAESFYTDEPSELA